MGGGIAGSQGEQFDIYDSNNTNVYPTEQQVLLKAAGVALGMDDAEGEAPKQQQQQPDSSDFSPVDSWPAPQHMPPPSAMANGRLASGELISS